MVILDSATRGNGDVRGLNKRCDHTGNAHPAPGNFAFRDKDTV